MVSSWICLLQRNNCKRPCGRSAFPPTIRRIFFINGYSYPEGQRLALPYDMVLTADVDELNFLAARLGQLDAAEIAELNAALQNPKGGFASIGQIIDFTENVDYYVHLPDVHTAAALGDYYLNRSGMVDMPQEWKAGIDTAQFGRHISQQEQGAFTEYGYIVKSDDEWQRVHEASRCRRNTG